MFTRKTEVRYAKSVQCSIYNDPNIINILSKAMRNILLNENCAAKMSHNLQISEFKKARENSNSFARKFGIFKYFSKNHQYQFVV